MAKAPPSVARTEASSTTLPIVAKPSLGLAPWAIAAGAVFAAILLFIVLDARRRAVVAPSVGARNIDTVSAAAPPPTLYIPPEPIPLQPIVPAPLPQATITLPQQQALPVREEPLRPVQQSAPAHQQPAAAPVSQPPRASSGSALMIDTSSAPAGNGSTGAGGPDRDSEESALGKIAGARVGAGVLASRMLTVPQGTLIPAVLETALDSTLPGLARAVVSSDVRGFDGTRVLIPRGSRLIGEYAANAEGGQNRMLVNWLRLIRPDGVTIAIGSPAADPVGQGGIRAKVNSHFFERFSGAILQSALDVGVNLASRSANSPVIVALPGAAGSVRQTVTPNQVRPTLKVKPAASISVFVARDLDFTGVEER